MLRNYPIGKRLTGAFAIVAGLIVLLAIVAAWAVTAQRAATNRVADLSETARIAGEVKFRAADFNGWQTAYAFDVIRGAVGAADDDAPSRASFLTSAAAFRDELAKLATRDLTDAERAAVESSSAAFEEFMKVDGEVVADYRAGTDASLAAANELVLGREIELFTAAFEGATKVVGSVGDRADGARADAGRTALIAWIALGLTVLVALGLAIFLARAITRSIVQPLGGLLGFASRVSAGDLRARETSRAEGHDELADVERAFDAMMASVSGIVQGIQTAAGTLAASSQQLAASADDVGRTVTQVAVAIGEVASGSERQVLVAHGATDASETARMTAARGVGDADSATAAMTRVESAASEIATAIAGLGERSTAIGGFVQTIAGIADQTNLLALNAAIEAARAGEHGRGFAVVAEEVRTLAEDARKAAHTIESLIAEIQGAVGDAGGLVSHAVDEVHTSSEIVARARGAFDEVDGASRQVDQAIGEVVSVTEQTSAACQEVGASAEEASSSAQEISGTAAALAQTAEELHELTARFTI